MKKAACRIWVSQDFKRWAKASAAKENISIIKFTKKIAKKEEEESINEKKFKFNL